MQRAPCPTSLSRPEQNLGRRSYLTSTNRINLMPRLQGKYFMLSLLPVIFLPRHNALRFRISFRDRARSTSQITYHILQNAYLSGSNISGSIFKPAVKWKPASRSSGFPIGKRVLELFRIISRLQHYNCSTIHIFICVWGNVGRTGNVNERLDTEL